MTQHQIEQTSNVSAQLLFTLLFTRLCVFQILRKLEFLPCFYNLQFATELLNGGYTEICSSAPGKATRISILEDTLFSARHRSFFRTTANKCPASILDVQSIMARDGATLQTILKLRKPTNFIAIFFVCNVSYSKSCQHTGPKNIFLKSVIGLSLALRDTENIESRNALLILSLLSHTFVSRPSLMRTAFAVFLLIAAQCHSTRVTCSQSNIYN